MDKAEMERIWNDNSVLNALKINRFKPDKTNMYKVTMTIFRHVPVDTITESGYYKTSGIAQYELEKRLREKKNEKYPYEEGDNKDLKWSFSYVQ